MSADTAEFAQERDEIEERRKQYIASTRDELATALRAAEEHLDHAERLTVLLGEGHLYDIEYTTTLAAKMRSDSSTTLRARSEPPTASSLPFPEQSFRLETTP